ncbi:hypothetical protein FRC11_003171 [Ceratobasidium sp. 423]|nr:hypothetical protein FRC11_003171 [Ceratobasidium sp. 423]
MPLNDKAIPSYMTLETGLQNLRADALFYQLGGLVTACDSFIKPRDPPVPPSRSFLVVGYTTTSRILSGTDPNSVSVSMLEWENPGPRDKNKWMTLVTEDTLGRMGRIQSPKSYTDFQGLRTVAAIEKLTSKLAGNYRQDGWKLKGWRIETVTPPEAPDSVRTEILIILGDFRSNAPKK